MKAIILFSGGLDSTVMLAAALASNRTCYALSFDYGQRHRIELDAAKDIARYYNIEHKIITIDRSTFGNSSLVSHEALPQNRSLQEIKTSKAPSTYVPARNTLFIAYAIGQAELIHANEIYFGPNAMDYEAYVDCRPAFVAAYQHLINGATKQAVEGSPPKLIAPLIHLTKKDIVKMGRELKAPLEMTWSCYDPSANRTPCLCCDACIIKQDAFYLR
jgi:7-cyano-7-deazaguanine synthase